MMFLKFYRSYRLYKELALEWNNGKMERIFDKYGGNDSCTQKHIWSHQLFDESLPITPRQCDKG